MSKRDDLITLLATRSAKRGTFTLASGRQSSLYIDARITTMSPDGLALIGPLGLAAIRDAGWRADSVGGLTLGADPIACAIAQTDAPLRAFTVRKEPKTHGTGRLIEGPFRSGDAVVVIEDTITTGGSALKAIDGVRAGGGAVVGVLALVDREEGGREALEAQGHRVISLALASEITPRIPSGSPSGGD
jgi:orotate phosphoribosyltransferase